MKREHEEAKAVRAMLDRPLTAEGAAQALGWPKARVTSRVSAHLAGDSVHRGHIQTAYASATSLHL